MAQSKKNYFDEIKKRKIGDNFIEHISRLIFFAILLTIEGIFKKLNEIRFRLENFFKGRGFSHILARYSEYKISVQSLLERPFYRGKVRAHLFEIKDRFFSDRDKKLIFGIKESTHTIVIKSRSALSRFRGYTISVGKKYFKPSPIFVSPKDYSALLFTFFLKKSRKIQGESIFFNKSGNKREYALNISEAYKKFMKYAFKKFYTSDFRSRVAIEAMKMKTVRDNVDKLLRSIEKLEKKQLQSAAEHSVN